MVVSSSEQGGQRLHLLSLTLSFFQPIREGTRRRCRFQSSSTCTESRSSGDRETFGTRAYSPPSARSSSSPSTTGLASWVRSLSASQLVANSWLSLGFSSDGILFFFLFVSAKSVFGLNSSHAQECSFAP